MERCERQKQQGREERELVEFFHWVRRDEGNLGLTEFGRWMDCFLNGRHSCDRSEK
jgi:hypothetical protein